MAVLTLTQGANTKEETQMRQVTQQRNRRNSRSKRFCKARPESLGNLLRTFSPTLQAGQVSFLFIYKRNKGQHSIQMMVGG